MLGLGLHLVNVADVQERLLGKIVETTIDDGFEGLDRFGDRHVLTVKAGEDLGDEERLRQEALDLTGTRHREPILFGQFVQTEDGNDVLQLFVALKGFLHTASDAVVVIANDLGAEDC